MPSSCVVPGCRTGYESLKVKRSVFKVPFDEINLRKWVAAIPDIEELKPFHFVCERHFEEKYIIRKYARRDHRGKLIAEVSINNYLLGISLPLVISNRKKIIF